MAVATKKNVVRLRSAGKSWKTKNKRERAVAVARDVLALLDARKITTSHSYLNFNYRDEDSPAPDADVRSMLLKTRKCEVCAKGALFVARTMGRNEVTVSEAGICAWSGRAYGDGDSMCNTLADCFVRDDLNEIERAYENGFDGFDGQWEAKYPDDRKRLRAIMQRVIDNRGRFTKRDYAHP